MPTAIDDGIETAARLMAGGAVMVLSGAGVSTESGIPDYRGPTGRARRSTPMTYDEFIASPAARQRYWARSHVGWRVVAGARPNPAHHAVAALQEAGLVSGIVTQNVDGLHQAAGARSVIELHGNLATVVCLTCRRRSTRAELHARLSDLNPSIGPSPRRVLAARPDGDAVVADAAVARFVVADCAACGGVNKPDVVFFGESVPKHRVERGRALVESSALLLVLGSSLQVMSGLRFVRHANALGIPVAIINQGATRADDLARLRIDAPLSAALAELTRALIPRR